ncbi:MAG: 2-hydroxyacid dehydrogenase [Propionibacteriaceae bacterium]|jgi:phosphoglycerate dehydrogenase-like enzyme|nr:2-hydroxyacid dehydrogenase [Propionibacteriaceae bacterium]
MERVIWVPDEQAEAVEKNLGGWPEGLTVDVYKYGEVPSSDPEFIVAPYAGFFKGFAEHLGELHNLKHIQLLSAGFDHALPVLPKGVTLHNASGVHDTAVAEMAVALALASLREIDQFSRKMEAGQWKQHFTDNLADKSCLILGYGHIGRAIERRVAGFEVREIVRVASTARVEEADGTVVLPTQAHPGAPIPTGSPTQVTVHSFKALDSLLPRAEVVFVACPLSDSTLRMLDAKRLSLLPDKALIVNIARGGVIDTEALVQAATEGRVRAALDVTDPEPLPPNHPLWHTPGVLITPHEAGVARAFFPRIAKLLAWQIAHFAGGEELENRVA